MKCRLLYTNLCFALSAVVSLISFTVMGQTNPEPFNLSGGPYSFTAWDSASPSGTFPPNMIFHFVSTNQVAPFYTDGASDYDCGYKQTKRPRINGLLSEGISILTTSSSQYNNCDSGAASNRFMGAVLVALNTTGRSNINVQWESETLIPGDGSPIPRVWNLRLQYRVGSTGLFSDVPGPVEYIASTTAGSPLTLGPTVLPAECSNMPLIQVRWIYFESSTGGSGTRPKLRLDEIAINSDIFQGINDFSASDKLFEIFPNPASGKFTVQTDASLQGTIKVLDILGKIVILKTFNSPANTINCTTLPDGIYFVQVTDDEKGLTKTKKLILR